MSDIDIVKWLIHIQGKNISESVLRDIKVALGVVPTSKKILFESITEIINKNDYAVDPKYVYENILGLHIDPVDLATENIIFREFEAIRGLVGELKMRQIPNSYILQKISDKYDLNIRNTVEFPVDRKRHYDIMLYSYFQSS